MQRFQVGDIGVVECVIGCNQRRCRFAAKILTADICGYTVRLLEDAIPLKKGNELGIGFDEFKLTTNK